MYFFKVERAEANDSLVLFGFKHFKWLLFDAGSGAEVQLPPEIYAQVHLNHRECNSLNVRMVSFVWSEGPVLTDWELRRTEEDGLKEHAKKDTRYVPKLIFFNASSAS